MNLWGTEDRIRTVSIFEVDTKMCQKHAYSDNVQALGIFTDLRNLLCWHVWF